MENEEIPSQPASDTSPQGVVSAPAVTDQPVETVIPTPILNPVNTGTDATAQIPADEPLSSPAPEPTEQSVDPVAGVPVSAESIPTPVPHTNIIRELLAKARAKIQSRKRVKIDRIMTMFDKREHPSSTAKQTTGQAHITNDEVEKLLHVSDATATRYLETLVKENKIRRIGTTGKYTTYEKI